MPIGLLIISPLFPHQHSKSGMDLSQASIISIPWTSRIQELRFVQTAKLLS
jgi:hypothetical protein